MRPVDKGNGNGPYAKYQDAGSDLRDAIGDYCSYCERQIETNLAVEHIQPKSTKKSLRNSWLNFLLGCGNCNSCKGRKQISLSDYFWPDCDNTLRAFEYHPAGLVNPRKFLRQTHRAKAQATIELVGLDRVPGHANPKKRPTKKDLRWSRRQQTFTLALKLRADLQQEDNPIVRHLIVVAALGRGLFSIWMQVFEGDADMRRRLIQGFLGTASKCFHPVTSAAVKRKGGQI
jgi:uncharacterized protein (TIGR02646 family)